MLGMLETVRIRRAGYPVRRIFGDFLFRYRVLQAGIDQNLSNPEQCAALLEKYDGGKTNWQIGNSKVILNIIAVCLFVGLIYKKKKNL